MPRVALLAAALVASAAGGRVVVPFTNGWRFHYGDDYKGHGAGPNECAFEDAVGLNCTFMETDPNRFTPEDCKTACCYNPDCMVWQQHQIFCFHGDRRSVCTPNAPNASGVVGVPWGPATGGLRRAAAPYQADYDYAARDYNDSAWPVVAAPHDFLINGTFTESTDVRRAFLPRSVGWYRKRFTAPALARSTVYFAGATHWKQIWLNGVPYMNHTNGYTPFQVEVPPGENVLSIRVDATFGSGHWYEGGGLNRKITLVTVPGAAWLAPGGVFIDPHSSGDAVSIQAEVAAPAALDGLSIRFTVRDPDRHEAVVGAVTLAVAADEWRGAAGPAVALVKGQLTPTEKLALWGPEDPKLYDIDVELLGRDEAVLDNVTVTTGFRTVHYGVGGFAINGATVALKGFSHHDNFAGLGTRQNARMGLFRARTSVAMGANFWRMSHNPYDDDLYATLNSMGVMSWDETRDFGIRYADEFEAMVRYHRSHASVTTWSFCNEYECAKFLSDDTGKAFQKLAKQHDPNRQTSANMHTFYKSVSPWGDVDIVGLSHETVQNFTAVHEAEPTRPLVLSECCSCVTDRIGTARDRDATNTCMAGQNRPGLGLPFVSGSIGVWTLMDYFGEQHEWPKVLCDFGQFDGAAFPKAHAWYYQRNWRGAAAQAATCKITTMLTSDDPHNTHVSAFIGSPRAVLYVDGKNEPTATATDFGAVRWNVGLDALAAAGNLTVVGEGGAVPVQCTVLRPHAPAALELVVDVPSASTGTGGALYLDGSDIALVRAQLVDARGTVVSGINNVVNVTFTVTHGPGFVLGVGNGNTTNHQKSGGDTIMTYGGLARGVVQVTVDCTTPHRLAVAGVDVDSGPVAFAATCNGVPGITVRAEAPGVAAAELTIPVSGDLADSPKEVAKQRKVRYTYVDNVQA